MILVDTSIYIEAAERNEIESLLEILAEREFIQSCDIIEREVLRAAEYLRKTNRKEIGERLRAIYENFAKGTIKTTERVSSLANDYHRACSLSKKQDRDIENDFLIVACASVAGIKAILSFNRKTMASEQAQLVYKKINDQKHLSIPDFITSENGLREFLKLL